LQGHDNKVYAFSSWSDGGAASHVVTTPAEPTAYVARFSQPKCGGGVGLGILLVMGCGAIARRLRRH